MALRIFVGCLIALAVQHALCTACIAEDGGLFHDAGTVISRAAGDQVPILASPFHMQLRDARWLVPLSGATAIFIATDSHVSRQLANDTTLADVSRAVSIAGSGAAGLGVAAAFYFAGRFADDARAREAGMLSGEALFDSWILVTALKVATNRARPFQDSGRGGFWQGGTSFPSGHSVTAWTVAAVVAREYRDHRWVPVVSYGAAALVGISRFTGHEHFPSDVLVGSTLGFLIGRSVFDRRHLAGIPREPGMSGMPGAPVLRLAGSRASARLSLEWGL